VVDFGDHRHVSVLEALDNVELPQWPRPVEWLRGHAGGQLGQLFVTSRNGKMGPANVKVEIEVGVIHEPWVLEAEGLGHHSLAEGSDQGHSMSHQVSDTPEVQASVDLARIEHHHAEDVQVGGG
jgi:hypothetical protein